MNAYRGVALLLLLAGVAGQFLWRALPPAEQADAWNVSQATLLLLVLALLAAAYRAWWVSLVCALLGAWQCMTVGCSLLYLIRPWATAPGQGQCSALLDLPLGAISGCVAVVLAWRIYEKGAYG